jgi:uncharacterized protein (TIGR03067 family)
MLSRTLDHEAAGVVGVATGSPAAVGANDCGRLHGRWAAVGARRGAQEAADIVGHHLHFEGDAFRIWDRDVVIYEGTFAIDASACPASIDFQHAGETCGGRTWRGIYSIDGDTLMICDDEGDPTKGRPTSFDAGTDSGRVLVVFKRVPW